MKHMYVCMQLCMYECRNNLDSISNQSFDHSHLFPSFFFLVLFIVFVYLFYFIFFFFGLEIKIRENKVQTQSFISRQLTQTMCKCLITSISTSIIVYVHLFLYETCRRKYIHTYIHIGLPSYLYYLLIFCDSLTS